MGDDNVPPLHWPLGVVTDVYPGSDNVVRVAMIRTAKGSFKRPVVKLYPLPSQPPHHIIGRSPNQGYETIRESLSLAERQIKVNHVGDVQPRKRKDKKRKKDDLGVNEPRGTSAALGEGDSFMHSHHDHGTGGHWCAKVIFFSLLAILVALIGLIILENRGLSELEANAVQSQYSGVLEGWLEDAPEDDHHDTHTLELNHHDDEDDAEHGEEIEHSDEVEDDDDDVSPEDEENTQDYEDEAQDGGDDDEESQDNEDGSQELDLEANDEDEELTYRKYYHGNEAEPDDDDDDDDEEDENEIAENNDDDDDDEDENETAENNDDDDEDENEKLSTEADQDNDDDDDQNNNRSLENDDQENEGDDDNEDNDPNNEAESEENNNKDEEEHDEGENEDTSLEVEKIEQEASEEEEPISAELPTLPEPADNDDDNKPQDSVEDEAPEVDDDDQSNEPDDDFLEVDDDEPPVERITAPAGKPFAEEEEEETSSEKPADTLAEEEEYEKRQEELRREEAQASHMWLKLTVGGALLVATHAIVRRATASSDEPTEQHVRREETPIDRRMTLIPEEPPESGRIIAFARNLHRFLYTVPIKKVTQESTQHIPSIVKSPPTFEESEEEVEEEEDEQEEPVVFKVTQAAQSEKQEEKQEMYSDEEDAEDDEVEVEEEKVIEQKAVPQVAKPPTPEPDDDVPDDVEIIEDEEIEEEAEEDEEEISDVDDEELLTRLEAKYGRLPEPERPQRRKDGGNSIEDEWPGEPSDAYWRSQLDQAEQEFNQKRLNVKFIHTSVSRNEEGRYTVALPSVKILQNWGILVLLLTVVCFTWRRSSSKCLLFAIPIIKSSQNICIMVVSNRKPESELMMMVTYIPHHAVIRPEKVTSPRVVLDASAKTHSDANLNGYGCVIYLPVAAQRYVTVRLLCSKSKVTPAKITNTCSLEEAMCSY
ncbi:hypothetical protein MSG28_010878 [Choristoneura fumiferana]|uniref:Uncharacterized protein n=1 Tax=Choristoneura fumiferana TaxID=7141 RepID=A0ACC0KQ71_CHOFU|nr:hypothetical protein MSG28_010878 [Choristoneura fumiferana]